MKKPVINGFTLIELTVVTLILSILLSSAFMSVSALRKSANINQAKRKLSEIEQALYGFAAANHYLPCPAIPGNGGISNQLNSISNCAGTLNISGFIGFVPSTTLGLKGRVNCDGLLLDPWGRPYRYSVTNANAANPLNLPLNTNADFVVRNGIQNENSPDSTDGMSLTRPNIVICRDLVNGCGVNGSPAVRYLSTNAVAVIFSMGETRPSSPIEMINAGQTNITGSTACGSMNYPLSNSRLYYSAPIVEKPGAEFDDIMLWISPNILFSKMLNAGALP
jgi:prepilin-type N-terminal cleavage/methylation domain-containing protein